MKRQSGKQILIEIVFIALLFTAVKYFFLNGLKEYYSLKHYPDSIEESKQWGTFIEEYKIMPSVVVHKQDTLIITKAWTEYYSGIRYQLVYFPRRQIFKTGHLRFEVTRKGNANTEKNLKDTPYFVLKGVGMGTDFLNYNTPTILDYNLQGDELFADTLFFSIINTWQDERKDDIKFIKKSISATKRLSL